MPGRESLDDECYRKFEALMRDLRSFAISNFEHYKAYEDVNSLRFVKSCSFLLEHIDHGVLPGVEYIINIARFYDFSELHPANGFRSLVKLIEKCCCHTLALMRFVSSNRRSLLFRGEYYGKELESYVQLLGQLRACLYYAEKYVSCSSNCDLITEKINEQQFEIMEKLHSLSAEPFYGTCLGFQLCQSMLQPVTLMHVILASYSESYMKPSVFMKLASTLVNSGKFIASPEQRAKKVINATMDEDISFCKSFWSLSENNVFHNIRKVVCPQMGVDKVFSVPPEPFQVSLCGNPSRSITVHPSRCHGDAAPVMVRLISYFSREGQASTHTHPPSDCLIVHVHGGGFVAQSSASHSLYLRHWAKELNIPIFSIDYSLAPEFPYPRQVEEIFFAYCWALNNCSSLGSTGKKICLVGDSAGANLAVSTALRAAHHGVRSPDGILSIYGSFLVRYAPSPSRLMAILDPILPLGLVIQCLSAYVGVCGSDYSKKVTDLKSSQGNNDISESTSKPDKSSEDLTSNHQSVITFDGNTCVVGSSPAEESLAADRTEEDSSFDNKLFIETSASAETKSEHSCVADQNKGDEAKLSGEDSPTKVQTGNVRSRRNMVRSISESAGGPLMKLRFPYRFYDSTEKSLRETRLDGDRPTDGEDVPRNVRSEPCSTFDFRNADSSCDVDDKDEGRTAGTSSSALRRECDKKSSFDVPDYASFRSCSPSVFRLLRLATEANLDPFLSPVFASSELLSKLCPVFFIACHFDPLLDESIHLAKRIRLSGGRASLDMVDDLPHGFLNFIHLSREANNASMLCVERIKEIFDVEFESASGPDIGSPTDCAGHPGDDDDDVNTPSSYDTCVIDSNVSIGSVTDDDDDDKKDEINLNDK